LAGLLAEEFGLGLAKTHQRDDWARRPLSSEQLLYAALDTAYLLPLWDRLKAQLVALGRLEWAEEEFALLDETRWAPADGEPAYLRLKGARALRGRELAILRELYEWREAAAQRSDRATFRILNNEPMLTMAKSPPKDLAALKAIPGIGGDQAERRGREILAAVQRGLDVPERDLPRIERPPRRAFDPAVEARLERLKAARNQLAARLDLQPGVLCPNGTLEAIARANPPTLDALRDTPELRRWQFQTIGPELLAAVKEPAAP
jgi:ribonuclease D